MLKLVLLLLSVGPCDLVSGHRHRDDGPVTVAQSRPWTRIRQLTGRLAAQRLALTWTNSKLEFRDNAEFRQIFTVEQWLPTVQLSNLTDLHELETASGVLYRARTSAV